MIRTCSIILQNPGLLLPPTALCTAAETSAHWSMRAQDNRLKSTDQDAGAANENADRGGSGEDGWHFASSLLHWVSRVRCTPLSGSGSGVWGSIHNCTRYYQYGVSDSVFNTDCYIYIIDKEDKEWTEWLSLSLCRDTKYTTGSPDYEMLFFMVAGGWISQAMIGRKKRRFRQLRGVIIEWQVDSGDSDRFMSSIEYGEHTYREGVLRGRWTWTWQSNCSCTTVGQTNEHGVYIHTEYIRVQTKRRTDQQFVCTCWPGKTNRGFQTMVK